jgi:hypothetical protein
VICLLTLGVGMPIPSHRRIQFLPSITSAGHIVVYCVIQKPHAALQITFQSLYSPIMLFLLEESNTPGLFLASVVFATVICF